MAKFISVGQIGDIWWSFSNWSILAPNAGKSRMEMFVNFPSERASVILVKIWLNFTSNSVGSLYRGIRGHSFPFIRIPNSHHKWKHFAFFVFPYTSWEYHWSQQNQMLRAQFMCLLRILAFYCFIFLTNHIVFWHIFENLLWK